MPEPALPVRRRAVADLLAAWVGDLPPLAPVELALAAARAAVVAAPVTIAAPRPAAAVALLDGRAVIAAETFGASPYAPAELTRSLAVRAGDPVPAPFDAVAAADEGTATTADAPLAPGANLRRIGADAAAGAVLLPVGTRLGARAVAVAAAAGIASIALRRGRAVVASTGPAPEVPLLVDLLAAHGFSTSIVPLDRWAATAAAAPCLAVVLGGAAIGASDPAWIAAATAPGWHPLGRPALRPGDTAVAGRIGASPALVLPGRLDDVLAAALALILPLADAWTGAVDPDRAARRPLARKLVSSIGLTELALFAATADGDGWEPLGVGTFAAAALARATHWALLPPESEGHDPTRPFAAHPWPEAP